MKTVPLLTIPVALWLTVLAVAHGPTSNDDPARHQQLQRNRYLIRDLVESGLRLAAEEDPLLRADYCQSLAESVVEEIRLSASEREMDRAVQLSDHLHVVLKLGVAGNLRITRLESSPSSTREIDVQRVGTQVRELMEPLEEFLRSHGADAFELGRALRSVRDAQAEVEKVLIVKTHR